MRARYYQPSVGRFLTRDTYTGEDDEPESLHLYVYCGHDGVNAWDPSGHWGKKTHERITNDVIKMVNRKLKSSQKNVKKLIKNSNYDKLIEGCTLPDRARARTKATDKEDVCDIPLDNDDYGKWHGKDKKSLKELTKEVTRKFVFDNYSMSDKYELLGAMLHSIQDKYAHSYVVSIDFYLKHFKAFEENSAAANYHNDRERIEGRDGKAVGLKKINFDKHADYKDNERKDFEKRKNYIRKKADWKDGYCDYSSNERIKGAIKDSKVYLYTVLSIYMEVKKK